MQGMDGVEATMQIREFLNSHGVAKVKQPKIFGVTGHVDRQFIDLGIEAGMDRVLSKPLDFTEIKNILE